MKKKIGIVVLAGGLNTRTSVRWPDIPKALIPINNQPNLFILLSSILNLKDTYKLIVTVIIPSGFKDKCQNECLRWIPEDAHNIVFIEQKHPRGTANALGELYAARRIGHNDAYLIVIQCNFPFLSTENIQHLIENHIGSDLPVSILCGKILSTVNINNGSFTRCVIKNGRAVCLIEPHENDDVNEEISNTFFLGTMIGSYDFFQTSLKNMDMDQFTEEFRIINFIDSAKNVEAKIVYIYPIYGSIDTICIDTPEDVQYAEHMFTQKRHASFLHHCYFLWKQYSNLDERLKKCEISLQK